MKKHIMRIMSRDDWKTKARFIKGRIDAFSRIFKSRKYEAPDDLFFAIEDLPLMGKEYWFLHFCTPGSRQQAILTFGRALDDVKVNRTNVNTRTKRAFDMLLSGIDCASVCWLYCEKKGKIVAIDSGVNLTLEGGAGKKMLKATGKTGTASIIGKYPHYHVQLKKGNKILLNAKVKPTNAGNPFEIIHMLNPPVLRGLGAEMVNYYFDFEGKIGGKNTSGRAYLQKVVAAMPLAPWNWVRIYFKSGASLDFFAAKTLEGSQQGIRVACVCFLEYKGKRIKLGCPRLESWLEGKERRWLLHAKGLYLALSSYAMHGFVMRSKTKFCYDEFLVEVKDFAAKINGKEITIDDVGAGCGIVEDAYGYLF
ncbi:hypothetical protein COU37_03660 [Candidatus Micrarchaeota archaeon CG10_big_fil_rev_8_21_14_0_10_45_29]|nr:MAG: hypothetical protein COU37_03660 [Candidatus Micrarchaeota archaeon CG10_big_fil_rev_8_21_14_0_10_45_29]